VTNVSRIAWVVGVGASRGLGAASVRRFAREGCKVAVTGRSPDALQLIVDEIVAAGGRAIVAPGDAKQEAAMVDILDRLENIGPVEVGVYNAGNAIWGPPLETKTADFEGDVAGRLPRRLHLRAGGGPPHVTTRLRDYHLLRGPSSSSRKSSICYIRRC
jgi:NAD(P)-dependent dehydrogenase (short-subunit alcohol dehydrogenase family)